MVRNDMDLVSGAALADAIGARNLTYYGAAVAYVAERVQFGRKIVSFPAIKHRCADMAIAADDARSAAIHAVSAVQEGGDALRPAAAVVSGRAFLEGARENVHLHGGIGFTWEHSAHLYFRRATSDAALFGSAERHRERVLAAVRWRCEAEGLLVAAPARHPVPAQPGRAYKGLTGADRLRTAVAAQRITAAPPTSTDVVGCSPRSSAAQQIVITGWVS